MIQKGSNRYNKVQVQVKNMYFRFRCTGAPAGSANTHVTLVT